jgi:2-dehydro-3-deoxygalactonokinase
MWNVLKQKKMDKFLSCDWGTSSFRLRLIRSDDLKTIAELENDEGISKTFKSWQESPGHPDRTRHYTDILNRQIKQLGKQSGFHLEGIPVILSGMASSTIGLLDLPYKKLPFQTDGSDLEIRSLNLNDLNPFIVISGARTDDDVMRGEETKIVGCAAFLKNPQEQLIIIPGTHPKHAVIKEGQVASFKTFMTGEFFDLLATRSILSASIEKGGDPTDPLNHNSFLKGVRAAQDSELLHASFMVRTNQVIKNISGEQNFYYLSGLLIGSELKGLKPDVPVYLLGGSTHLSLYTSACETIGITIAGSMDADAALIKGQQILMRLPR